MLAVFRLFGTIIGFIAFGMAATNAYAFFRRRKTENGWVHRALNLMTYRSGLFGVVAFSGAFFRVFGVLHVTPLDPRDIIAPILAIAIIIGEVRTADMEVRLITFQRETHE